MTDHRLGDDIFCNNAGKKLDSPHVVDKIDNLPCTDGQDKMRRAIAVRRRYGLQVRIPLHQGLECFVDSITEPHNHLCHFGRQRTCKFKAVCCNAAQGSQSTFSWPAAIGSLTASRFIMANLHLSDESHIGKGTEMCIILVSTLALI